MGVAPEAIVKEFFFEYRLKYIVPNCNLQFETFYDNIVGCASALPMVVAPEAIVEYFWV
jgi:hypothetical protein